MTEGEGPDLVAKGKGPFGEVETGVKPAEENQPGVKDGELTGAEDETPVGSEEDANNAKEKNKPKVKDKVGNA